MASNTTPTKAEFRGAWRSAFKGEATIEDHEALEKVMRYAAYAAGLSYDDEVMPKARRPKQAAAA